MSPWRRLASVIAASVVLAALFPVAVFGCSPPFEEPTIRALGPTQLVVLGRIGERVAGGRQFHVERWFNGGAPATPIVIAFKEGEAVGDCSYPITTGANLIIAPYLEPDGRLSADLLTLQADPATDQGRKYVAEATALFGPGVVPPAPPAPAAPAAAAEPADGSPTPWIVVLIGLGAAAAGVAARRRGWSVPSRD